MSVTVPIIRLRTDTGEEAMVLRDPLCDQCDSLFLCQETAAAMWPLLKRFAETGSMR